MDIGKFILILCGILVFGGILAGFMYSQLVKSFECDIGEMNISGDYKVIPNTFFNNRYCAIEDCSAFNKWQHIHGKEEICVV